MFALHPLAGLPNNADSACCVIKWLTMKEKRLTLLNTSILTSFGTYNYEPLPLEAARALVEEFKREGKTIESAIGHQTTAELLSSLLGF